MARCTGSLLKFIYTAIFFFQAEDGIRDKLVTGVQTVCSSDLAGVAIGLVLAGVLSRAIAAQLFQVAAIDPVLYAVATTLLVVVALLACGVPAVRAVRVDPARSEERRVGKECRSRWSR